MSIKHIPASDFKLAVMDSSLHTPIAVFFTASWCDPCQKVLALLEAVAESYEGRLNIAVLDVDADDVEPVLEACQVSSIPDVKLFHQKALVAQAKGVVSRDQIDQLLAPYVPTPEQHRVHTLEKQVEVLLAAEQYEQAQQLVEDYKTNYPLDQDVRIIEIAIAVKMNLLDLAQRLIEQLPAALKDSEKAQTVIRMIDQLSHQTVQ